MKTHQVPHSVWTNPIHFIAFGFGSGAAPVAPGTFGTLMAIPLYLLAQKLSLPTYTLVLVLAILIGFWLCHVTARDLGVHDHPGIVWDEIVGYGLTMWAAPTGWLWVGLGFILFRIFDIWKPWPIRLIDRHVKGGIGIVVDDLLAAVYAWAFLHLAVLILLPNYMIRW